MVIDIKRVDLENGPSGVREDYVKGKLE